MKFLFVISLLSLTLSAFNTKSYQSALLLKKMTVKEKKARFYALVEPAVQKVHAELTVQYKRVKSDIEADKETQEMARLKEIYKVESDEKLLLALKPHPQSIAIAQAAMESAWGTSRFFVKAKNIFGMWSVNPDEPRIAASEMRSGTRTIWLKKFSTIEESVREYYKLMGRGFAFDEFRRVRSETEDVFLIIEKLDRYSEIGDKYAEELGSMIRYNKLLKYDK